MNLYQEARAIAQDAWDETGGDLDAARDHIYQTCDGYEDVIYTHKAIKFCAEQDTSAGEEWLEDCGSIVQPGDSFGAIASRIAFATLLCAAEEALAEIAVEAEKTEEDSDD